MNLRVYEFMRLCIYAFMMGAYWGEIAIVLSLPSLREATRRPLPDPSRNLMPTPGVAFMRSSLTPTENQPQKRINAMGASQMPACMCM
jgi:hypothetical protein